MEEGVKCACLTAGAKALAVRGNGRSRSGNTPAPFYQQGAIIRAAINCPGIALRFLLHRTSKDRLIIDLWVRKKCPLTFNQCDGRGCFESAASLADNDVAGTLSKSHICFKGSGLCRPSFTSRMKQFKRSGELERCCRGCSPAERISTKCRGTFWWARSGRATIWRNIGSARRAKCCTAAWIIFIARRWRRGSGRSSRSSTSGSSTAGENSSDKETGVTSTPETLLIDVARFDAAKNQPVQIRSLEDLRHRKRQIRKHLGFRAVHAPGQAGDRGIARPGRRQRDRAVRDPEP